MEIITIEEAIVRLKIGRTKFFEILKKGGRLIPGQHYFKNGRVLRVVWSIDLIKAINEVPVSTKPETIPDFRNPPPLRKSELKTATVNMEY